MKIGDKVPKDDYEYYVVEKLFVKQKKNSAVDNDDYSNHKIGERIIVKKNDLTTEFGGYAQSFKEFLKNNCRKATKEEESKMYDENFCNALVLDIYDDKSYQISFYYVPIKDIGLKEYIEETDWWKKLTKKEKILKKMGINETTFYEIDDEGRFLYNKGYKASNKLLEYCRLATKEETKKFNKIIAEKNKIQHEKYLEKKKAEEQEKLDRYNKNKSDANYYPGSCGNYNQVLVNSDGTIEKSKLYDLYTIRQFYSELLNSEKFDEDILKHLIFYGGTVPYILSDTKEETRKFGDIDIFIPIENMKRFRNELLDKPYFTMYFDSMNLTKKAGLIIAESKFQIPLYTGEINDLTAYQEYEKMVSRLEKEARKNMIYQDYGFKGSLFGINISVFPIYQWGKNNNLDICAKSFRIGKEDGDSKFLLNTVVTHNTPITSFSKLVEICGGKIGAANLEYTIASKKSAINHGYILRQQSDLADLEFIEQNKEILSINDNLVKHYENNIPDYGIAKVYRIKRNYEISEYTPEEYKNIVTINHKPS